MTTIACDGRSMAGDGLITENDHVCQRDYPKVRRLSDGRIVGLCGNSFNWDAFAAWLEKEEGDPPKMDEGIGVLVLCADGSLWQYNEHGRRFLEAAPCAIGSGQRFALAAMDFGKSASEAVEYACSRDIFSGGQITELSLDALVRVVV
jgi:ATP-dependent protease HslVU (ClpYQ) peptidase subunit